MLGIPEIRAKECRSQQLIAHAAGRVDEAITGWGKQKKQKKSKKVKESKRNLKQAIEI